MLIYRLRAPLSNHAVDWAQLRKLFTASHGPIRLCLACRRVELQRSYTLATKCAYNKNAVLMGKSIIPVRKSLKSQCKSIMDLGLIRIPPSPPVLLIAMGCEHSR